MSRANELNSPKPMTLNSDAATICIQATPRGIAALRPCSRINANRDSALIENPRKRSVHTLISANAIVMTGQLRPQTKARSTSSSLALVISSNPCGEATNHLYDISWRRDGACGCKRDAELWSSTARRTFWRRRGDLHKHKHTRSKIGRWLPHRAPLIPADAGSKLRCGGLGMASVPIPKFASLRGTLVCELRNQRDTSNL